MGCDQVVHVICEWDVCPLAESLLLPCRLTALKQWRRTSFTSDSTCGMTWARICFNGAASGRPGSHQGRLSRCRRVGSGIKPCGFPCRRASHACNRSSIDAVLPRSRRQQDCGVCTTSHGEYKKHSACGSGSRDRSCRPWNTGRSRRYTHIT